MDRLPGLSGKHFRKLQFKIYLLCNNKKLCYMCNLQNMNTKHKLNDDLKLKISHDMCLFFIILQQKLPRLRLILNKKGCQVGNWWSMKTVNSLSLTLPKLN